MAKKNETTPTDTDQPEGAVAPPTNYQGQVANQETTVRDAKDGEKPDESSIVQVEEIKD